MHTSISILDHETVSAAAGSWGEQKLAAWQQRRAIETMRARLSSDLRISAVASECQLSPSNFARMFRYSMGVAPHEYLSKLRIEEAKRLMVQTKLPLTDIALIAGFSNQAQFTRVFLRQVDVSPGVWRRSCSEGN